MTPARNKQALPMDPGLRSFICEAIEFNREVIENLNVPMGEWKGPSWDLVRYLKLHSGIREWGAEQAADVVDQVLRGECHPDERSDPWLSAYFGSWNGVNYSDIHPFDHFIEAWEQVLYAMDETPVELAVHRARKHPIRPPPELSAARHGAYYHFVSVCRALQQIIGPAEPIFVPVRKFAEILETSTGTISGWRKRAVRGGYLVPAATHPKSARLADEFYFRDSK